MSEDNEAFLERQNEIILERVLERLKSAPAPAAPIPAAPAAPTAAPKPNGNVEPAAVEYAEPEPMSATTQWAIIGGIVAVIAVAWKFAGGLKG